MARNDRQSTRGSPMVTGGPGATPPGRLPASAIRMIVFIDLVTVLPSVGLILWASLTGGQARIWQVAPIAALLVGIGMFLMIRTLMRAIAAQRRERGW